MDILIYNKNSNYANNLFYLWDFFITFKVITLKK